MVDRLAALPFMIVACVPCVAGCGPSDESEPEAGAISDQSVTITGDDASGDYVCEDAAATPDPALDLISCSGQLQGGILSVDVDFNGDFETYLGSGPQDQPGFTMQLQSGGISVVEALFDTRESMKVPDGNAAITYSVTGGRLQITLTDFNSGLGPLEGITFTSFADDFAASWSGRCTDEMAPDWVPN